MLSSQDFLTRDIVSRVFNIKFGSNSATTFLIEHNSLNYFVTAKHLFPKINNNESVKVEILQDGIWKNIEVIAYYDTINIIDIIILEPKNLPFSNSGIILKEINLILGDEGFFLGFPYGISVPDIGNNNNGFPFPLFKKAIHSGSSLTNNIFTIYLDGHNNPGFSGGPVLFKNRLDPKDKNYYLVGVISAYVPQINEIKTPNGILKYNENSGIILAYNVKHIIELVDKIKTP